MVWCSESFARSETSLIFLEKNLITEIEKAICNMNRKLVGIGGDSMLSMDTIVMNF